MSVYKVRMTVLARVSANDDFEATQVAREVASDAGLDLLQVEAPDLIPPKVQYGSAEEDIYP